MFFRVDGMRCGVELWEIWSADFRARTRNRFFFFLQYVCPRTWYSDGLKEPSKDVVS